MPQNIQVNINTGNDCAVRQHAINWANVDPVLCHNELKKKKEQNLIGVNPATAALL